MVSDGANAIYVAFSGYTDAQLTYKVGDYVEVTSPWKAYYVNGLQLNGTTATPKIMQLAQSGTAPTAPAATATTIADFNTNMKATPIAIKQGMHISIPDCRYDGKTFIVNGLDTSIGVNSSYLADGLSIPVGVWGTVDAYILGANSYTSSGATKYSFAIIADKFTKNAAVAATGVTVSAAGDASSVYAGQTLQMSAVVAPTLSDQTVT